MAVMIERTLLGRAGTPEEVAEVAAVLLSDGASFLTGTDVLVDGGVLGRVVDSPAPGGPSGNTTEG